MNLVSYEKEAIEKGKRKLENNEFLRDLSDLMENDKFKKFFNKYMHNWLDIKCTTIYMRLYVEFKDAKKPPYWGIIEILYFFVLK